MIDTSQIKYRLVLVASDGKQHDIREYVQDLGWEENKRELAARISFTVINAETSIGLLSKVLRPGCLMIVQIENGSEITEVARGTIMEWKPQHSGSQNKLSMKCYDDVYNLQKSQEPLYYSEGSSTESILTDIFKRWNIPYDTYSGPNATHGKLVYKTESLADVILDVLDDAKKKGGGRGLIRSSKGKIQVTTYGSNKEIYFFEYENSKTTTHTMSISDLVTRVKIISQESKDEHASVEATLDGLTQYGIRQKIYSRNKDDSLEDAKKAAQEILDEDGTVSHDISLQVPDVPYVRKGDLIYCNVGTLAKTYCYVLGVQHDAESRLMTMDLEITSAPSSSNNTPKAAESKTYNVGDIVTFNGGTHYVSSTGSKGYKVKGTGQAKITIVKSGAAHPYHLIHTDSKCNVYGWVDNGTFT